MKGARTIYLIKRLETCSRVMLDEALGGIGLTAGQYTTLSLLGRYRDMSSADLARRALITPQSMSEVIAVLEKKGLITRRNSEANRRILRISLSAEGSALLERAEALADGVETALFALLDEDGLRSLRQTLITVLDQPGDPADGSAAGGR